LEEQEHFERMAILKRLLEEDPRWLDGYGLFAGEAFMLASTYHEPKDYPKAKDVLDQAIQKVDGLVEREPQALLAKFFLAAAMAKKSSLDGIMSSLRYGSRIRRLWEEVLASQKDLWFRPNVSLQGSVRYGLGMFYRLVPDRWMMQRLFAIRGNLERSVALHREGLHLNPEDPCASLMLAASLLCQSGVKSPHEMPEEAAQLLEKARRLPSFDKNQTLCQLDSERLQRRPAIACHYSQTAS
jgi:hypothetical protein